MNTKNTKLEREKIIRSNYIYSFTMGLPLLPSLRCSDTSPENRNPHWRVEGRQDYSPLGLAQLRLQVLLLLGCFMSKVYIYIYIIYILYFYQNKITVL